MSSNRRVPGRVFPVVVILVAIIATIVGWRAMSRRPVPTTIIDTLDIDGEYAVLIRDVADDPERSFLSLYHATRGEVWGALIPRYAATPGRERGVVATDEVITVRAIRNRKAFLMAFDARHGRKLGSVFPLRDEASQSPSPRDGAMLPGVDSLGDSGEVFEVLGAAEGGEVLVGFDLDRGRVRWTTELGSSPIRGMRLRATRVIIEQADGVALADRDNGALERWPGAASPCVTADRMYASTGKQPGQGADGQAASNQLQVVGLDVAASGDSRVSAAIVAPAWLTLAGPCGVRGDVLVVVVGQGDEAGEAGAMSAVVALRRDALERGEIAPVWRVDLGRSWSQDRVTRQAPDRSPMAGELTRFVPVLVGAPDVLVMVDVDTGRIAWQSPQRPSLRDARLMSAAGRHYLYQPGTRNLAVFDGDSGALHQAVILEGYNEVTPYHIAGQRIWLSAGETWTVLDGATLRAIPGVSVSRDITTVTDRVAEELGAPGSM